MLVLYLIIEGEKGKYVEYSSMTTVENHISHFFQKGQNIAFSNFKTAITLKLGRV